MKRYLYLAAGTFLMAAAYKSIYQSVGMVTGGFSGIGVIVNRVTGGVWAGGVPLWITNVTLNVPLFIAAFYIEGKEFIKNTVTGAVLLTLYLAVLPAVPVDAADYLLAAVYGGAACGAGIGLVLKSGFTTGGTDMLGVLLHRFFRQYALASIIQVLHWPGPLPTGWLRDALEQIFIAAPQLSAVVLPWAEWREEPQALTLFGQVKSDIIHRTAFWQLPLWLSSPANRASGEMVFDAEREIYFPQRPPRPQGEVYRRYDPRIRRMLSFRIADPVSDAERFTRWMNDPRVEYFWEQSGSLEVQTAYLERQLTGKHAFPLIGCFDDRPFSYFEIYWAAEDRIGRHYSWQPFDRGLHLLVGEQQWRGAHYVQSWLRGLTHYLLLDEPRTQRTVLEPRTDNQRLFRHLEPAGYRTIKEFDFPHKRSRMVMADRHHFFTEVGL